MPLDPHVKQFLDMISIGVPKAHTFTPAEMRLAFASLTQMVERKDSPACYAEDGTCPGPEGALPIRTYTAASAPSGPRPALIYFHGGGWIFGDLDTHDVLCRALAHESGCRLISVSYRLAPEHKFPAGVEDACAATRWVADNASSLGIDGARIAVAGDSAGGNLAAVVCQRAKREGGPSIALQMLLCPALDLAAEAPSREAFAKGYFLDKTTIDWTIGHYCGAGEDLEDPRISPLRAADLSGLPPAHIHTAEFDPLRDEGNAYAERLAQAGVPVQHTCHPGMIHHFTGMGGVIPYARPALQAIGGAIKQALA